MALRVISVRAHQQSWLKCLNSLSECLLNVNGTTDTVLCGTKGQLNLQGSVRTVKRHGLGALGKHDMAAMLQLKLPIVLHTACCSNNCNPFCLNICRVLLLLVVAVLVIVVLLLLLLTSGVFAVTAGSFSPFLNRASASGPISLGSVGLLLKGSPSTTSISGNKSATARTCRGNSSSMYITHALQRLGCRSSMW